MGILDPEASGDEACRMNQREAVSLRSLLQRRPVLGSRAASRARREALSPSRPLGAGGSRRPASRGGYPGASARPLRATTARREDFKARSSDYGGST